MIIGKYLKVTGFCLDGNHKTVNRIEVFSSLVYSCKSQIHPSEPEHGKILYFKLYVYLCLLKMLSSFHSICITKEC